MVLGSPSAASAAKLVYWFPNDTEEEPSGAPDACPDTPAQAGDADSPAGGPGRVSMYVTVFEDMLKTVLFGESALFVQAELDCFMAWHRLPYNAKYLFCRLCLRQKDKWHRLGALNYESEVGSDGIVAAMKLLCGNEEAKPKLEERDLVIPDILPTFKIVEDIKPKIEETEPNLPSPTPQQTGPGVIDLTAEDSEQPQAGPSRLSPVCDPPSSNPSSQSSIAPDYSVFADDEDNATLAHLLDSLKSHELEELAKQLKVKLASKKRDILIEAILRHAARQTTLPFVSKSKKGKTPMVQTRLPFKLTPDSQHTQQERLREMVMKKLVKCIRLNAHVVALFQRANLVYFRSTQHSPDMLIPSILTKAKKRVYAKYKFVRTTHIWPTRGDLLAYEEALAIEAEVDQLLDGTAFNTGARRHSTVSKTPAIEIKEEAQESERVKNARKVKEIFERVFERWRDLSKVKTEGDAAEAVRRRGLERFDYGHILTRVVCKGAHALGILKEYKEELLVLEALLEQRRWRRARRGRWYERSALVLMHHLKEEEGSFERAIKIIHTALYDPDTHIVFRPSLVQRLTRLEKRLKIPPERRHVCEARQQKATEVYVEGIRIRHRAGSMLLDQAGRVVNTGTDKSTTLLWSNRRETTPMKASYAEDKPEKNGKSIWKGRDDEEVTVEIFALQHYESHGYKGFHCEGRIVTTLFGLLFWDVIFEPIPGAFETPYQNAPLDIMEDTFYYTRQDQADKRLEQIATGNGPVLLARAYDEHKDVWCVGVRWDLFGKEDLLAIVRCIDPKALSAICRVMCEDYSSRTSGVPDLIVWKEFATDGEDGEQVERWAKFVEVKGPGDNLQENQKVWIDVLLQANMPVELCHVYEQGQEPKTRKLKTPKTEKVAKPSTRKRKRQSEERIIESEDEEDEFNYSQLDIHLEDEDEEGASPSKRPRRSTRLASVAEDLPPRWIQRPSDREHTPTHPQNRSPFSPQEQV